jgi:lipid-A-disaccharide synthase
MPHSADYSDKPLRLVISVGESSGDFLGARLASQLKTHIPNLEIAGIAGPLMKEQGVIDWFDMNELNVMGLQEVIVHLPRLMRLRYQFQKRIMEWQPDAFIGIDAPDFNLRLSRRLKHNGLRTFQYVSPSVWAWRPKRAIKISRSVDHLLTLFPFEPPLFTRYGLDTEAVGHPLADELETHIKQQTPIHDSSALALLLLPGSRWAELRAHVPLVLKTAQRIRRHHPTLIIRMNLANQEHRVWLETNHAKDLNDLSVHLSVGDTKAALARSSFALCASGTVTLEAFLMGVPQVVFYQLAPLTHWLAKTFGLVRSEWISLPNILTQSSLVPELVQKDANPDQLEDALMAWLNQPERVQGYCEKAEEIRGALQSNDRAAQAILRRLDD